MSLKSTLKSFLFEDDPAPKPEEPATKAASVATQAPVAPVTTIHTVDSQKAAKIDQKLQENLMKAVIAVGALAYKALDDTMDSLEDVIPDVGVRYKKALEISAKQGYTLPIILSDVDKALGALEESARDFELGQKERFNESVGTLHNSVQNLSSTIEHKKAQLEALQQEILSLTQKRDTDQASISTAQSDIDYVGGRFKLIYQALFQEMQGQRNSIVSLMEATK